MKIIAIIVSLLPGILFAQKTELKKQEERLAKGLAFVSTGNSFSSAGNFAAISTDKTTLKASTFFLLSNKQMLTIDVSAGATQGVATVFDEGKLNSNNGIGSDYRFLINDENALVSEDLDKQKAIYKEIDSAEKEYQDKIKLLFTFAKKDNGNNPFTDPNLLKKLKSIDSLLSEYSKSSLSNPSGQGSYNRNRITTLQALKVEIESKMGNTSTVEEMFNKKVATLQYERNTKIDAAKTKLSALKSKSIRLEYLSIGYKASNNNFVRFVDSLSLSNQLIKESYTSHRVGVSYNLITNLKGSINNYERSRRQFLSIGALYDYTNNINSLSQIEVIDSKIIDAENGRIVQKKQKAFTGEYLEGINNLTVYIDYYSFFDRGKDAIAIHLNPTILFIDDKKPVATFQIGFLVPFKSKKKQSVVTNLEIFYRLKDIFNTTDNKNSLLNRNIIGLQTSFPFNF